MTDQERWERSAAISARIRELIAGMNALPKVPIVGFLDAEMRRKYRRFATRLRAGKVEPRYLNLFTAEQLANICEQAAARDEYLEKAVEELQQRAAELRAMLAENEAELAKETMPALLHAKDAAQWLGPDSQAEQRYRDIQQVRRKGQRRRNNRPRKPEPPQLMTLPGYDYETYRRHWLTAAELVTEVPAGEPVLRFPDDAGEDRMLLSIGIGPAAWIGSYSRGETKYSTVQLMPDNRHLIVVTDGAGYVIDAVSHALVAELGRDIATVVCEESSPLLLIDHGGTSLEAFGAEGRLWQTGAIACGGFRDFDVADGVLSFEALQEDGGWVEVGVSQSGCVHSR